MQRLGYSCLLILDVLTARIRFDLSLRSGWVSMLSASMALNVWQVWIPLGTSAQPRSQGAGHPGEEDIGGLVLVGGLRPLRIAATLTLV